MQGAANSGVMTVVPESSGGNFWIISLRKTSLLEFRLKNKDLAVFLFFFLEVNDAAALLKKPKTKQKKTGPPENMVDD